MITVDLLNDVVQSGPAWKMTLRSGLFPCLPTHGLQALAKALEADAWCLMQGATMDPPPLACCQDWLVQRADPIAYALMYGHRLRTVGEVETAWAHAMHDCGQTMGEESACRYFLTWWDDTPREEAFALLLIEVRHELNQRRQVA